MKEESYDQHIAPFYHLNGTLHYYNLQIEFMAKENVTIDVWSGSVIRNNLLYAAENVKVSGVVSLLSIINTIPISENHTLYKNLAGGFPKGFALSVLSHRLVCPEFQLKKGDVLTFSLVLFGYFANYYTEFIQAIRYMCRRGIGKPLTPFYLVRVSEQSMDGQSYPVAGEDISGILPLHHPISLSSYMPSKFNSLEKQIGIRYTVPVNLYNTSIKINTQQSYQDKQNGFPGFYQLIRSSAYRIATLSALYSFPDQLHFYVSAESGIELFIQYATSVLLTSAQLQRVSLRSTAKQGNHERILFSGYTGELVFSGNFNYYVPLLLFAQYIGVGGNTVYGLGRYEIFKPVKENNL